MTHSISQESAVHQECTAWTAASLIGLQDQAQPVSKQIRLSREEDDVVSSSLPIPGNTLNATQSSATHASAGPQRSAEARHDASASVGNGENASAAAEAQTQSVMPARCEEQDPVATSLPLPQANQSLSTFLAAYDSDSDSDNG